MTRVRKHTCGAGALLGVLLLAAFAGTALTLHYEARGIVRGQALDRAAGRVFAAWFQAAHRASQDQAAAFAQTLKDGNAIILTPARLRALGTAPPGLPDAPGRNAMFSFGVIADGTPRGVPMAFGVLEPSLDGGAAHGVAIREGALGSGLAGLESVGGGALMAPHLPAIEAALGRSLGPGRTLCHGRSRASISGAGALPPRAARPGVSEPAGNRPRHEFRRSGQSCGPEYRAGRRGDWARRWPERRLPKSAAMPWWMMPSWLGGLPRWTSPRGSSAARR